MLPACKAAHAAREAQDAAVQRAVDARDKGLLDVALEAERLGEVRRVVILALHLAPRAEQRLEDHADRLREAGGGVFHVRRQPAQAAIPGRPDAHPRPAAKEQPQRQRYRQQAEAHQGDAQRRDRAAQLLRVAQHPTVGLAQISGQRLADELLRDRLQQFQEQRREQPKEHARRRQQAHARQPWSGTPRARAPRARCAVGPGR